MTRRNRRRHARARRAERRVPVRRPYEFIAHSNGRPVRRGEMFEIVSGGGARARGFWRAADGREIRRGR